MAIKGKLINGKIVKFAQLPKTFSGQNHYINFDKVSDEVAEKEGFYDIIIPEHDSASQVIHNLHHDPAYDDGVKVRNVFIYDVKDRVFESSLADMKADKIQELKAVAKRQLELTDWYVIRKAEKGTAIPDDVETQRDNIRSSVESQEASINAKTKKVDVYKFNINL